MTVRPYRQAGLLVDLPGALVGVGEAAGLVPYERNVALLAGVRDDRLVPRVSFFPLEQVRKSRQRRRAPARGSPTRTSWSCGKAPCELPVDRSHGAGRRDLMSGPEWRCGVHPQTKTQRPRRKATCLASRATSGPRRGLPAPARGARSRCREAATYLNVTERYMRRLVTERRIPYFKVGRLLRFSADDLDAFLEACRIEPGAAHPLLAPRRRLGDRGERPPWAR